MTSGHAIAVSPNQLIPWKTIDRQGRYAGIVLAANALDAAGQIPADHSLYVGGPSPECPDRAWWTDAWRAGAVDPDELFGNDPRLGAE